MTMSEFPKIIDGSLFPTEEAYNDIRNDVCMKYLKIGCELLNKNKEEKIKYREING